MSQANNLEHHKFSDFKKARDFVIGQGFKYSEGKPISMGEGYEHIFIYEYPHKTDLNKTCRLADLQNIQKKVQPEDNIPVLFDFFQVSIQTLKN